MSQEENSIFSKLDEIIKTLKNHELEEMKLFWDTRDKLWNVEKLIEEGLLELRKDIGFIKQDVSALKNSDQTHAKDIQQLKINQERNKTFIYVWFLLIVILFILSLK